MKPIEKIVFKDLRTHIADAIKQSCNRIDARFYNIANNVQNMGNFSFKLGIEIEQDLTRIMDQTIKEATGVGCDLSVIAQGLLLGTFRSSTFNRPEADKTLGLLIYEILDPVFKYNGDLIQAIEGIMSATMIISKEYKIETETFLKTAKENILTSSQALNVKFGDGPKGPSV